MSARRRPATGPRPPSAAGRRAAARARGFTLVEVLVALMIVAIGLAALLVAVSGTARTSGFLRDKIIAQWIALNRLSEVRLNTNKFAQNTDTGEVYSANRTWHYDTRYFDTSVPSMKRIVVRVYAGDAKTKGSPLAESTGFMSTTLNLPGAGLSNVPWNVGMTVESLGGTSSGGATGTGAAPNPANSALPGAATPGTSTLPGTTPGATIPTTPPSQ
ncbi:MAG TPA: type II secretion system minor pseudopilin GspI [Steroidobacteraceae bacterium]|nr:type II secretion system minor pseudopilin GspI [Steroidobacteraceae bacterium]